MKLIEVRLKVWRSTHNYVLKIPKELEHIFLKIMDNEKYVKIYIPVPEEEKK